MSEPAPDKDDASARPWWALRAAGLGLIVTGLGLHQAGLEIVGWCAGTLGLALALFGGDEAAPAQPRLPPEEGSTSDQAPPPRARSIKALAFGGAAIAAIGLLSIISDVRSEVNATSAWWAVIASVVGLICAAVWSALEDISFAAGDGGEDASAAVSDASPFAAQRHHLTTLFVVLVLATEVIVPCTYYFGADRFDERFAWRMFSDVRVYRCQLSAFDLHGEAATPVALGREVHVAWINTMRRSREGVLQRYLSWRCENAEVDGARVINRCMTPEGESVPAVVRQISCDSGLVTSIEAE